MDRTAVHICLIITDRDPEYGAYALHTAAKILSELRAGRQDRDLSISWKLASSDCRDPRRIVLCGRGSCRSRRQSQAYLDYIQRQICDMMDSRKISFQLQLGNCQ